MNIYQELREKNGFTKKALAKLLKISHTEVADWENGKREPNEENAKKLASLYGVSVYKFYDEIKIADDPFTAKSKLILINPDVAEEFAKKVETENKIIVIKAKNKKPKYYVSKFDTGVKKIITGTATVLIVAGLSFSSIVIKDYFNPEKFGTITNLTIIAERIDCAEDSCVFRIVKVLQGKYENDYIELKGVEDLENGKFVIGILEIEGNHKVRYYTPWSDTNLIQF